MSDDQPQSDQSPSDQSRSDQSPSAPASGDASRSGPSTVAGGVESSTGPAGSRGPESVDVSGDDLDVPPGPREDGAGPIDPDQFADGSSAAGGTGGANAGGAG